MAKNTFFIIFLKISSIPFILIANIINLLNIKSFKDDIEKSLKTIDDFSNIKIDKRFIQILILAEDRRNKLHCGIDTIAILRAIKVRILNNKYQGASTIEQQFIRVVTNRFEKTFYRKFREQTLAIMLIKVAKKEDIAKSYLLIAYYGYNLTGLLAIEKFCNNIKDVNDKNIVEIVARLKYPQPKNLNDIWLVKKNRRILYIEELISKNK
ncbi:transglycosylase domain-containing protein [Aliarcobacter butzleri]|uniref:transglycosylase domain-containing protein n=1 Tax=Aliarcobacter butzleri TaxID=28197 RepID=UPI001ED9D6B6|nr:transglycosylase domain-containing protein [Aliarcobacter butzleri]MCG3673918.1 transglycosylase domain-containing protein [Aliarcobacter butzleri]MCG3683553.1 transglycosylase domain-containing protein [Aliarcobacter butzleri]MDK2090358.1 transglycosylase domain-containing protein [Aliarcobacter butzleri]MDN5092443.1 transglycosylase domain-containing protein [Aliarcobacter butzleri]